MPSHDKPIPELEAALADLDKWLEHPGRTKSDLARHLGVSRQRLRVWLTRASPPDLEGWFRIKNFLREQRRRKIM
jgi:transposase-like protein